MSYAMTMQKSKISEILQKLMREKNIHVAELARRINLKQPTLQRIASGLYQRPHTKSLMPIADFFGISLEQLMGLEPITWLPAKNETINRIPVLTPSQVISWPDSTFEDFSPPKILIDINLGKNAYAMTCPDASMEPLFPKGALLIIDPDKEAKDRSFVIVKLADYHEAIFRQLLIDGKERYIKPLSPDFERFKMALVKSDDIILGVLAQVRLDYSD